MDNVVTEPRLVALGLSAAARGQCEAQGLSAILGRVSRVDRGIATVETAQGALRVENAGREELVVGDWLGLDGDTPVLVNRITELARLGGPHKDQRQTVVSNVDLVVIVHSAAAQFRLGLLSTFLVMAYDAGAKPLVLISKADLCDDIDGLTDLVTTKLGGAETLAISTTTGQGLENLRQRINGQTIVLLGESGTGKSTLTNYLCGSELLHAGELSRSGQGKHTTTHRELVIIPSGGVVIDTPGVRDAASFSGERGIALAFQDVSDVIARCRFHDCAHGETSGCAVSEAIRSGQLDSERVDAYLAEIAQRANVTGRLEERQRTEAPKPRKRRVRPQDDEDTTEY
jgi:ribosome biogenesis GTPase